MDLTPAAVVLVAAALLLILTFGAFAIVSWRERERRATRVSLAIVLVAVILSVAVVLAPEPVQIAVLTALALAGAVFVVLFLLPIGGLRAGPEIPRNRVDERDTIFARWRLRSGTPEYETYYSMRPENQEVDDRARSLPGLLSPEAKMADPVLFAAADASFFLTESMRDAVDGPVAETQVAASPDSLTEFVKDLAMQLGALVAGVAKLQPYHVYSHIGRGTGTYGEPVELDHEYAIAVTVEMDFDMVGTAPTAPVVMESARQYGESARIAVPLAATLRNLGYSARAHIDGNYRVIAPLVARDAGLGEIGRMGLLMTPGHGPRVRIAVVTTDAPLVADDRTDGSSVIDFCTVCKKCADCCPSRSLPFGDREMLDGALRWRLDADTCFRYWSTIGTDCARCMAVCPYSHPNTFSHNVLRWGIARSGFVRRAALKLDDLFYGRKPAARPAPGWLDVEEPEADL